MTCWSLKPYAALLAILLFCGIKRGVAIPPTEQAQKIYRQIFGTLDGLGEEDEEP